MAEASVLNNHHYQGVILDRTHPRTARILVGQRLAWYRVKADPAYWAGHWRQHLSCSVYPRAQRGELGCLAAPLIRYLPKQGRILEAGCGLGQYVLALQTRGYDIEGVEWAEDTVRAVKAVCPALPIRVGDVTALDVPDGHYASYVSLGVVEHEQAGPESFLREAYRVLQLEGVALIAVPHFHALRRLKAFLGLYRGTIENLEFYQYAFTDVEFDSLLRAAGFSVVGHVHYDGFKGLKDEIPVLQWLCSWQWVGCRVERLFRRADLLGEPFGHMLLAICRKTRASGSPMPARVW